MISANKVPVFVVTFGLAVTVIYTVSEVMTWTLFSYHPATDRIEFGTQLPRKGEGPVMYWYGWTVGSLLGGLIVGTLATMLPDNLAKRIAPSLLWIVPIFAFIILAYALRSFFMRD
jgi:hypothetical protein